MTRSTKHQLRGLLTDLVTYASDGDQDGVRETFLALQHERLLDAAGDVIDELHRVYTLREFGA